MSKIKAILNELYMQFSQMRHLTEAAPVITSDEVTELIKVNETNEEF